MKKYCVILLAMLIANTASGASAFNNPVFVSCYDGDTCKFNLKGLPRVFGHKISIRIIGIDTPEMRGKCQAEKSKAKEAKVFINRFLRSAKKIRLVEVERGKYFRLLARIEADGQDISRLMIKKGLARPYEGGKRKGWCFTSF